MTTPLRRRLRHARRGLWYAAAIGLVLMALAAAVMSQLLPLAERHPQRIAAWLSERAGRPVAFDRVETQWTRRGPLLRLDNLRVGSGRQTVVIGDAEMLVSQYIGLLPGHSFTELRLRGLDLTLQRGSDGRWSVRGLPGQQQPGGDPFDALEGLGELQVIAARLEVDAPDLGIAATLPRVDLRLRVDGARVRSGVRAWSKAGRSPLEAVLDFDRRRGDGRAYFAAKRADLAAWSPLLHIAGVVIEAGSGRAQAWAELRRHRVAAVTVDAALDHLRLHGAPLPDVQARPTRASHGDFAQLRVRARWRLVDGGWCVDAPILRVKKGNRSQVLDGLALAGGRQFGLHADRIDADPLFTVLALSDRAPPQLRRWLLAAHPQAVLRDVQVAGRSGGALRASGTVESFGFGAVGDAPGLAQLSGRFDGDAQGLRFVFDPARPLRFDWPAGFGVPHVVRLRGEVAGWREGSGWRVATPALRVDGGEFGADVRGGLWFQGDGTRPWIDLAAQLAPTRVPVARGFWIRYLMPPAAVRWLDAALVDGRVEEGRALVSGDLDDWPFNGNNGRFEADAHIADATLKFQPDWPAATHVDGDVSFVADGFGITGKAVLADVGIRRFSAGIGHFAKADLVVDAEGGGDASRLLGLLRQSPLYAEHRDTLDNLTARGLAAVTFRLGLPLHDDGAPKLGGAVVLAGGKLTEKRWKLAFDNVRGRAEYGGNGFAANRLAVVHAGQPGRLSLRAGGYVRDPRQGFEAELDASLSGDDLVARAPDLAWLAPYLDGRSVWTASVVMPKSATPASAPPSHLQLRSNLVGTALTLPAPLRKPATQALATTIDAALPLGDGEVAVTLGNVLALRARSGAQTGVRVVLGTGNAVEAPPVSGLVATGRADVLDALDWATVARGGQRGGSLKLQRIDVSAARLRLLGAEYPDTRLQVTSAPGGIGVQLQGDAIAGSISVPDASGATVAGRFSRVYWRSPAAAAAAGTTADGGADVDPADVPPLAFDIADFRYGDAALGSATLRTRPAAGGLRIEQLQTRAPEQRLDIRGDWSGRGAAARTRVDIGIVSNDFGSLLAEFGYGGQLSGGSGKATLAAGWSGNPAAFRLDALDGSLTLAVRNGQLTEVEPGAGRVLGLLSIAQLPRRLTLDFRDFFSKGFAFDTLDGEVRVGAGRARSDNLVIDGPAAEIRISGVTDLRAQQFDQTIDVYPKAGNLLTAVGAIAGGPVGAAIGAAANAVLKKPLGRLAAKTYRVTGPWKEPRVEVISREQSQLGRAQSLPAGNG